MSIYYFPPTVPFDPVSRYTPVPSVRYTCHTVVGQAQQVSTQHNGFTTKKIFVQPAKSTQILSLSKHVQFTQITKKLRKLRKFDDLSGEPLDTSSWLLYLNSAKQLIISSNNRLEIADFVGKICIAILQSPSMTNTAMYHVYD